MNGGIVLIVGIDPGKTGGVAFIDTETQQAEVYDMPTLTEFTELLSSRKSKILRVFIEKQQVFPGQGIVSSGNLMRHYGELIGVLVALRIPFEEVPPKRWQAHFFGRRRMSRKERKRMSIEIAKRLFPNAEIGKKDGRADAILIAEYGRVVLK